MGEIVVSSKMVLEQLDIHWISTGSYQNIKAKTIKFLEANTGTNLQDLGLGKAFFDMLLR